MNLRSLLLVALLAGCQSQPSPVTPASLRTLLLSITSEDLASALAIAQRDQDNRAIKCIVFVQGFVPTLAGNPGPIIPVTGVASALETARVVVGAAEGGAGLTGTQLEDLDMACAPLSVDVTRQVAAGALMVAGGINTNTFVQMLLGLAKEIP